jgi:inward rectifier potassium channel
MHPINEQSPLYGFSAESLAESQSQIIVSLSGIDETVYQNVHARHTYGANSIILNHQLVDIIHVVDDRNHYVDLASFHHVVPLWTWDFLDLFEGKNMNKMVMKLA